MIIFYLVRHGQHDKLPGDQPLNAVGRRQAAETARYLAALPIDAVYASPLARACETGEIIAAELGLPLAVDERLRERANFGDLPGQTFEEFLNMWRQCDLDRTHQPRIGLSAQANGERMQEWMLETYNTLPNGRVLACTHGGTITDFLLNRYPASFLERLRPGFREQFGNCSITTVRIHRGRFALETLASTAHLA